ncbi:hypothetical protein K6V98_03635 [Collinsella sp. AGMB00827]|uniref:Immunity protein 35 domain-containing protein n=1 Tax=Collinsella ureilytica TaxID=2869515 RepID=A0ABS7MJ98_9ACTN|nr:hypothetical protein [Collinsella urealyticum]MBY4797448.1 hypothetical protein [Collinsella urealyticum]
MITFNEAKEKAKKLFPSANYFSEYEDAFVFSDYEDCSIGGSSPLVVLKSSGDCINYIAYTSGHNELVTIEEGYISAVG